MSPVSRARAQPDQQRALRDRQVRVHALAQRRVELCAQQRLHQEQPRAAAHQDDARQSLRRQLVLRQTPPRQRDRPLHQRREQRRDRLRGHRDALLPARPQRHRDLRLVALSREALLRLHALLQQHRLLVRRQRTHAALAQHAHAVRQQQAVEVLPAQVAVAVRRADPVVAPRHLQNRHVEGPASQVVHQHVPRELIHVGRLLRVVRVRNGGRGRLRAQRHLVETRNASCRHRRRPLVVVESRRNAYHRVVNRCVAKRVDLLMHIAENRRCHVFRCVLAGHVTVVHLELDKLVRRRNQVACPKPPVARNQRIVVLHADESLGVGDDLLRTTPTLLKRCGSRENALLAHIHEGRINVAAVIQRDMAEGAVLPYTHLHRACSQVNSDDVGTSAFRSYHRFAENRGNNTDWTHG